MPGWSRSTPTAICGTSARWSIPATSRARLPTSAARLRRSERQRELQPRHVAVLPRRRRLRARPAGSEPRLADEPQPRRSQGLGRAHGRREVRLRSRHLRLDREEHHRPVNNASVPTANATNGSWGSATVANILADVNQVLGDVITNSGETAMPNALLLPTTRFLTLNNTQLTNANDSLLKFIQRTTATRRSPGSRSTFARAASLRPPAPPRPSA
jgi:hypothetical protein